MRELYDPRPPGPPTPASPEIRAGVPAVIPHEAAKRVIAEAGTR